MNQKLSDWANVAEIVSGVAVVVTLIFLIIGIRENTDITRASMYDRTLDSVNQWRMTVANNDKLLKAWSDRGPDLDMEQWSGPDRLRLLFLANSLWGTYEKAFYAREYSIIGDNEWVRFETQICLQYQGEAPEVRDLFPSFLTPRFIEYVEELCR
jgi:hypothetical protein